MINKQDIFEKLRRVDDPELGINIVDLGLVYDVSIKGSGKVVIKMTLTTPGCPLAGFIDKLVDEAVSSIEGVSDVTTELTFDPPWTQDMMSEEARANLGL